MNFYKCYHVANKLHSFHAWLSWQSSSSQGKKEKSKKEKTNKRNQKDVWESFLCVLFLHFLLFVRLIFPPLLFSFFVILSPFTMPLAYFWWFFAQDIPLFFFRAYSWIPIPRNPNWLYYGGYIHTYFSVCVK